MIIRELIIKQTRIWKSQTTVPFKEGLTSVFQQFFYAQYESMKKKKWAAVAP